MINRISLFVLVFILISCKEDQLQDSFIYFDQPQPENVNTISSFPKEYLGSFNRNFSRQLEVEANCILKVNIDDYEVAKCQIDSFPFFEFKNNIVYDKETQKALKTTIKNDTITWQTEQIDTLFSFAEDEVAKIYKSSLILNKEIDGKYVVTIIKFDFSSNKFIPFGTKKDFMMINQQLKIPFEANIEIADTTFVVLKPSRADFRKLLRLDGFEYERLYYFK